MKSLLLILALVISVFLVVGLIRIRSSHNEVVITIDTSEDGGEKIVSQAKEVTAELLDKSGKALRAAGDQLRKE